MKTINFSASNKLSRVEMKKITGGLLPGGGGGGDLHFQCACQTTSREWGCISISGCTSTGDSICPGDYRCTTVSVS